MEGVTFEVGQVVHSNALPEVDKLNVLFDHCVKQVDNCFEEPFVQITKLPMHGAECDLGLVEFDKLPESFEFPNVEMSYEKRGPGLYTMMKNVLPTDQESSKQALKAHHDAMLKFDPVSVEDVNGILRQYLDNFELNHQNYTHPLKVNLGLSDYMPEVNSLMKLSDIQDCMRDAISDIDVKIPGFNMPNGEAGFFGSFSHMKHQPFKLTKAVVLYKNSAPKVYMGFRRRDHAKVNACIRDLTDLKCSSPVNHDALFWVTDAFKRLQIPVVLTIQRAGDVVFTMPGAMFQVFDMGPNYAETVNLWTSHVLPIISETKACDCPERLELFNDVGYDYVDYLVTQKEDEIYNTIYRRTITPNSEGDIEIVTNAVKTFGTRFQKGPNGDNVLRIRRREGPTIQQPRQHAIEQDHEDEENVDVEHVERTNVPNPPVSLSTPEHASDHIDSIVKNLMADLLRSVDSFLLGRVEPNIVDGTPVVVLSTGLRRHEASFSAVPDDPSMEFGHKDLAGVGSSIADVVVDSEDAPQGSGFSEEDAPVSAEVPLAMVQGSHASHTNELLMEVDEPISKDNADSFDVFMENDQEELEDGEIFEPMDEGMSSYVEDPRLARSSRQSMQIEVPRTVMPTVPPISEQITVGNADGNQQASFGGVSQLVESLVTLHVTKATASIVQGSQSDPSAPSIASRSTTSIIPNDPVFDSPKKDSDRESGELVSSDSERSEDSPDERFRTNGNETDSSVGSSSYRHDEFMEVDDYHGNDDEIDFFGIVNQNKQVLDELHARSGQFSSGLPVDVEETIDTSVIPESPPIVDGIVRSVEHPVVGIEQPENDGTIESQTPDASVKDDESDGMDIDDEDDPSVGMPDNDNATTPSPVSQESRATLNEKVPLCENRLEIDGMPDTVGDDSPQESASDAESIPPVTSTNKRNVSLRSKNSFNRLRAALPKNSAAMKAAYKTGLRKEKRQKKDLVPARYRQRDCAKRRKQQRLVKKEVPRSPLTVFFRRKVANVARRLQTLRKRLNVKDLGDAVRTALQAKVNLEEEEIAEIVMTRKLLQAFIKFAQGNRNIVLDRIAHGYDERWLIAHYVIWSDIEARKLFKLCMRTSGLDPQYVENVMSSQACFDTEFKVNREGRIPAEDIKKIVDQTLL